MNPRWALPASAAILGVSLLMPGIASAHEQRDVGNYHFVVGFLNEPAVLDQMNAIDLTVTNKADQKPVDGVDKTLKAEVVVGGNAATMPVPLAARFGLPGKYAGYVIPTLPGGYTFHFTGTINGDQVDQKFSSGPNTFSDVAPADNLQFPIKLGDPANTNAQVASAQSVASQGRVFGLVGLVLGAIGVALGGAALWTRRKTY
ncbi:MAG: hypothetical protein JO247_15690 [Chloroflexi bacterium]|nr:hypothetical protein [Chloroflexota bacterium]